MRDPAISTTKIAPAADSELVATAIATIEETRPSPTAPTTLEAINRFRDEIATEFERREIEIERRERSLNEQLAAHDREQRALRLAEQAFQQKCYERESAQVARDAEFAQRLTRCEALVAELEDEQAALDADRATLESQKQSIREAALAELASERQSIDAERESLFAEKKEFRRRAELHEKELSTARDELRKSWDTERETLRKQLIAKLATELSADRHEFEQQQAEWEDRKRDEQAQLDHDRDVNEQVIAKAKGDLERLSREQELEFARRRRELEAEIDARVRSAEAAFHRQQAEWEHARATTEAELRELRTSLEEQRAKQADELAVACAEFERYQEERLREIEASGVAERERFETERSESLAALSQQKERLGRELAAFETARTAFDEEQRQRWERVTAELAGLRQKQEHDLSSARLAFEKEQEAARIALDEERAVMENRLQFQRDHLERTRDELEEARGELERRLQQGRTQAVGLAEQFRLRQMQLARFRELLDDREAAIDREWTALAEIRKQTEDEVRRERSQLQRDEEARTREMDAERTAVKHLQADIAARAEQIEARQTRLDTLRRELESTHRENLELRVALDETWVKLSQAADPEKAKQQVQATRALVADHFKQKEAEVERRRAMFEDEALFARRQLDSLDIRRKELNEWLSSTLGTLQRREEELKRWATTLDAREARATAVAARWRDERCSAEGVIRDLLRQLSSVTSDPANAVTVESAAIAGRLTSDNRSSQERVTGPHFGISARQSQNLPTPNAS